MLLNKCKYTVKKKWYSVLYCHDPDHNTNVYYSEDLKSYMIKLHEEK
jgi:hypothetical protein